MIDAARFVSHRQKYNLAMAETISSPPSSADSYWLTRFVMLRLLGFVYAVAFLVAAKQILPLIGSDGLLPVNLFLEQVQHQLGSQVAGFMQLPSLFWFAHSDAVLQTTAWIGFALSCVVMAGYANAILMTVLWVLYMSFVHVGQDWYGYGWEIQLLETGFFAIFLSPLLDGRPFPKREPPVVVLWLFRWLIFRIMVGAALIKLRGDSCWRNLTALYYHFETQPIPGPLSRWFNFLPHWILKLGVVFNFLAELIAPWFAFYPRIGRRIAGVIMVLFQLTLISSGNLSFLNWLTIVPVLACFDDGFWAKLLPHALVKRATAAAASAQPSLPMQRTAWGVAAVITLLSLQPVANLISPDQIMNTSFDSLDLVNTYGAFGSVGRERFNVVFEGTDAATLDSNAVWKAYPYQALPVALNKRPPQIAPYQPRLDWQMWFAAMSTPEQYPWTLNLIWKLLHNDPGTLSLFGRNPFPKKPPHYIRAVLYRYQFTPPGNPAGNWWTRKKLGLWLPPLSADDPRLISFLQQAGWLGKTNSSSPQTLRRRPVRESKAIAQNNRRGS
jgi:Lipase maturation factor